MNSAQILSAYEIAISGYLERDWERAKITLEELLQEGIKTGLTTDRKDIGEAAGERIMEISAQSRDSKRSA